MIVYVVYEEWNGEGRSKPKFVGSTLEKAQEYVNKYNIKYADILELVVDNDYGHRTDW